MHAKNLVRTAITDQHAFDGTSHVFHLHSPFTYFYFGNSFHKNCKRIFYHEQMIATNDSQTDNRNFPSISLFNLDLNLIFSGTNCCQSFTFSQFLYGSFKRVLPPVSCKLLNKTENKWSCIFGENKIYDSEKKRYKASSTVFAETVFLLL